MHYYFKILLCIRHYYCQLKYIQEGLFLHPKKSSFFAFFFSYYVYAFDPFEWNICLKVSWILHRVSNTKNGFVMQLPLSYCKKRPFLCTSIGVLVFTSQWKTGSKKLYYMHRPAPSLSKEMEPETRIYWNILCRSISICTATITKCNQKRYYYMSNPFLN